jgi:hypothetical protein
MGRVMRIHRRRPSRFGWIVGLSLVLHAIVLAWLAWPASPDFLAAGPDLPLMSVELVSPARPKPSVTRSSSTPAARRAVDRASESGSEAIEPSPFPPVSAVETAPSGPSAPAAVGGPAAPANLAAALRAGAGCARTTSRSRQEREACEEKLGRLDPAGPRYDAPMDPGKRAYFDEVAAAGASGRSYGDPKPGGAAPDGDYFRVLNCSIKVGAGRKPKGRQGEVRLGRTPCAIPLQGSFLAPEASVRKR